jgi:hypothetical protein
MHLLMGVDLLEEGETRVEELNNVTVSKHSYCDRYFLHSLTSYMLKASF